MADVASSFNILIYLSVRLFVLKSTYLHSAGDHVLLELSALHHPTNQNNSVDIKQLS